MIIVQTPLRVSLFGGGTDFPGFYLQEGGCVLSSAIDKYIFVTIKQRFDQKLRVGYTKTEMVDSIDEIKHELIREALRLTGVQRGVEITTMGDIPSEGSGLGSSSTVTVGTLHALYTYLSETATQEQLAREACKIELDILRKPIGVQDQYIAAYGGLRFITFNTDGSIDCRRVDLDTQVKRTIDESLLLFFTGITRKSSSILSEQKVNISHRIPVLRRMKEIAVEACREIEAGELDAIGHFMDEAWQLKKQMASGISNGDIDRLYDNAKKAGAIGGKITGAGGGGFLVLYVPREKQDQVRESLSDLQELPFALGIDGSKVIFNYRRG
jgi:D-glycero-alpha-D-manno-heptose-7-phosphate kinase